MKSHAERKRLERERAHAQFGVKPHTLYLRPGEFDAARAYLSRRYGHDGSLRSIRAQETVAATPRDNPTADQAQLSFGGLVP